MYLPNERGDAFGGYSALKALNLAATLASQSNLSRKTPTVADYRDPVESGSRDFGVVTWRGCEVLGLGLVPFWKRPEREIIWPIHCARCIDYFDAAFLSIACGAKVSHIAGAVSDRASYCLGILDVSLVCAAVRKNENIVRTGSPADDSYNAWLDNRGYFCQACSSKMRASYGRS